MKKILPLALYSALLLGSTLAQTGTTTARTTTPAVRTTTSTGKSVAPMMGSVNVNTASAAELARVPGIGPKVAAEIVKNRPYKDSAELVKKVKGIGPRNIKTIEKYLSFK